MLKIPKQHYSWYSKTMAYTETGSLRQIKEISTNAGASWTTLTNEERKQLKRGQFAFGSLYPYVFDGLANAATHCSKLFQPHNKYYYELELLIDDLCKLSLMGYERYNREHFIHELLRRGSTTDKEEAEHLRCIPLKAGKYISIQPLIIGFGKEKQEKIPHSTLKKLMNLKTYSEHTKVINSVIILVLKILIDPLFEGNAGGWFSCPNALQAKIIHTLQTLKSRERAREKEHPIRYYNLDPLFLRRYFLYLNSQDASLNTKYIETDALDLWEHVLPSELNVDGDRKYIRDWNKARKKLEAANRFFKTMEAKGLMEGAKAFPTSSPKGIYCHKDDTKYRIYFKRSPEITL